MAGVEFESITLDTAEIAYELVRSVEQFNSAEVELITETAVTAEAVASPVVIYEQVADIGVGPQGAPGTNGLDGQPGPPGPAGVSEDDMTYAKRVDFVGDSLLYRGEAAVGSAESEAVWRIRKIVIGGDGDITETWAGGSALFDKVWDDRTTEAYS